MIECSEAVAAARGDDALEAMSYVMTRNSFGPVLRPLVSVALALGGGDPAALFARIGDGLKMAMRGVDVTWREDERALFLRYKVQLPDGVVASWRGVARFLFELAGRDGRLAAHALSADRRSLTLTFDW
jgi:hypothetical protein